MTRFTRAPLQPVGMVLISSFGNENLLMARGFLSESHYMESPSSGPTKLRWFAGASQLTHLPSKTVFST